jgi:hypothetical protein
VVETQIASAMATVDENHAATNAKLDKLMENMGALSGWMQSMSTPTTGLTKNTTLLQLHAEYTASLLSLLEADAVARRAGVTEPITPTTTVVRIDTEKGPLGAARLFMYKGMIHGSINHLICLRAMVCFMIHANRSTKVLHLRISVLIRHTISISHTIPAPRASTPPHLVWHNFKDGLPQI